MTSSTAHAGAAVKLTARTARQIKARMDPRMLALSASFLAFLATKSRIESGDCVKRPDRTVHHVQTRSTASITTTSSRSFRTNPFLIVLSFSPRPLASPI
jgi:hypothetical protein